MAVWGVYRVTSSCSTIPRPSDDSRLTGGAPFRFKTPRRPRHASGRGTVWVDFAWVRGRLSSGADGKSPRNSSQIAGDDLSVSPFETTQKDRKSRTLKITTQHGQGLHPHHKWSWFCRRWAKVQRHASRGENEHPVKIGKYFRVSPEKLLHSVLIVDSLIRRQFPTESRVRACRSKIEPR